MPSKTLVLAVSIAVATFVSPASAGCAKDADCKGHRVCSAGTCVEPATSEESTRQDVVETRGQTSVRFERHGKPSVVVIEGNRCTTPCSLLLPVGAHSALIDGRSVDIKVPETPNGGSAYFRSDLDLLDIVGGSVVVGVGFTAALITLLIGTGAFYHTDEYGDSSGLAPLQDGVTAIFLIPHIIAMAVGGVWLGLGIAHSGPRVVVDAHHSAFELRGFGFTF